MAHVLNPLYRRCPVTSTSVCLGPDIVGGLLCACWEGGVEHARPYEELSMNTNMFSCAQASRKSVAEHKCVLLSGLQSFAKNYCVAQRVPHSSWRRDIGFALFVCSNNAKCEAKVKGHASRMTASEHSVLHCCLMQRHSSPQMPRLKLRPTFQAMSFCLCYGATEGHLSIWVRTP